MQVIHSPQKSAHRAGFTIVELLIVIVVIGILAAITIVAYNGVQQKAREATLKSDLTNVAKKMAVDLATNDSYALTAAAVDGNNGLPSSSGTTYQFHSTANSYCITGTNKTTSFKISDSNTAPSLGGCAGDGQGGVAAVTNLESNPSFETTAMNGAGAGTGVRSISATQKMFGNNSTKFIWSTAAAGVQTSIITVQPLTTYFVSLYAYAESGALPGFTVAASDYGTNARALGSVSGLGAWQRLQMSYTTVAGQTTLRAWTTVGSASTFYTDGVLIAQGAGPYGYGDGSTPSWIWNGTPNNATSTGPAS